MISAGTVRLAARSAGPGDSGKGTVEIGDTFTGTGNPSSTQYQFAFKATHK